MSAMHNEEQLVERTLSFVLEELDQRRADTCHAPLAWMESILLALSPPRYERYSPREALMECERLLCDEQHSFDIEAVHECVGDSLRVGAVLSLLVTSAQLVGDAFLAIELFEKESVARVALSFAGPGRFPTELTPLPSLRIPLCAVLEAWTAVTRGGYAERLSGGLMLYLEGNAPVPALKPDNEILLAQVQRARQTVEHAPAAAGKTVLDTLGAVETALPARRQPADIGALLREVLDRDREALSSRGVPIERVDGAVGPPIAVCRQRVAQLFESVLALAVTALPNGGSLLIEQNHVESARALTVSFAIRGAQFDEEPIFEPAAIRRAARDEGGTADFARDAQCLTVSLRLFDNVGRKLDDFIPGWDRFTGRSRQMLRLLYSGEQAPPRELLLAGILGEELQNSLLRMLRQPAAVNFATDTDGDAVDAIASPERLRKALGQVRRRSPRKELADPPYAAELLHVYLQSDRGVRALQLDCVDESDREALVTALLRTPPDYQQALRIIAVWQQGLTPNA